MSKRTEEHAFSIELNSKDYLKQFTMSKDAKEEVLIEGCLGELGRLSFIEGAMLEIRGTYGILRIDLRDRSIEFACAHERLLEGYNYICLLEGH